MRNFWKILNLPVSGLYALIMLALVLVCVYGYAKRKGIRVSVPRVVHIRFEGAGSGWDGPGEQALEVAAARG